MRVKIVWTIILIVTFASLPSATLAATAVDRVKTALDEQVAAWNRGDLENAMSYYWNSPEMLWINRSGVTRGYEKVLDEYRSGFADRSKMGVFSYTPLHIEQVGDRSVLYVFRWKVLRDGKQIMGGVSSQIWRKKGRRWLITAEHAS